MTDHKRLLETVEQNGERLRYETILDYVPQDADRVLNVGATKGSHVERQKGSLHEILDEYVDGEVVGVDIVEFEVKRMQREGYDVRVGDMQALEDAVAEAFDVVVAGEVIEHVPNPGQALQSVHKVLKPSGAAVLTTPNPDGFVYYRRALLNQPNAQDHTCWIDPQNMLQLLKLIDVDYKVESFQFLPVTWGLSKLVCLVGFERSGASGYLVELAKDD